jgi:hypothetical protein
MSPDSTTDPILEANAPSGEPAEPSLMSLLGIGKDAFQSLGGGEAFIRYGREHFYDAGECPDAKGPV